MFTTDLLTPTCRNHLEFYGVSFCKKISTFGEKYSPHLKNFYVKVGQ